MTTDVRDAPEFARLLTALAAGYVPEWVQRDRGAEVAVVQIVAHYLQAVARRLEQAPLKNELAFLELLGIRLIAALFSGFGGDPHALHVTCASKTVGRVAPMNRSSTSPRQRAYASARAPVGRRTAYRDLCFDGLHG